MAAQIAVGDDAGEAAVGVDDADAAEAVITSYSIHYTKLYEGYPPYNIEQVAEDGLRITLAVAGFSEADLSVV